MFPDDIKHFDRSEFDYPDQMDHWFLRALDLAREHAGVPFIITSDYRTLRRNEEIGGAKDSPHLYGMAVDIAVHSSRERYLIVYGLLKAGFRRLGVYDKHVHADTLVDDKHLSELLWVGTSK